MTGSQKNMDPSHMRLNDAIRLVAQAGKGAVMMKRDLKSAFHHIPISPCDYWLLLFEWQGKFYVDMFLPFGLRTAPRIFNLFAEALHWILETLHEWNVTHYLDDFLFVFPPGTNIAPLSTEFDRILSKFGLSKAAEKDSDGCVIVHLGFEFDSVNMCVILPPKSTPSTTKGGFPRPFSMIPALTLSSGEGNAHTAKEPRKFAFPSLPQSFSESSHNSAPQNKTATSKRHFAWHLPPFYDAENLHGILGQAPNTFPPLQDIMSNSTLTTP